MNLERLRRELTSLLIKVRNGDISPDYAVSRTIGLAELYASYRTEQISQNFKGAMSALEVQNRLIDAAARNKPTFMERISGRRTMLFDTVKLG